MSMESVDEDEQLGTDSEEENSEMSDSEVSFVFYSTESQLGFFVFSFQFVTVTSRGI